MPAETDADDERPQRDDVELLQGRISFADLYRLGPVTGDRAYNILRARTAKRKEEDERKEEGRRVRARKRGAESLEKAKLFESLSLVTKADIIACTLAQLRAILCVTDCLNVSEHRKLSKRDTMLAYILALP